MDENWYRELVEIRHERHAHPELSEREFETTDFLSKKLKEYGIEILPSTLKTGLVAKMGSGRPVVALRADIDALPIREMTNLPFSSQNAGVMHACGHDLHMVSLLGAARILKARESELSGTVKLIFQPAEELGTGAQQVLESGCVDDVEAFIGYHNVPTLGTGLIGLREKGVMAAVEQFYVTVTGVGSHAAYPHEGVDPILAISAIVQALQQIVARNVPPLEAAVVSVTHLEAGNTWNVLPDRATFEGTIRTFDEKVGLLTKQRFIEVVENTAAAYGVEADIQWVMSGNLTYNDPELTRLIFETTKKWHAKVSSTVPPSSAGEDFAHYRAQAPSVFALIGSNELGSVGLHHADMIVRDEVLPVAVDYFVHSAFAMLEYLG